jgi:Ca2+/Na+ antiporter
MRGTPNKFVTLGFSIAALASSTIPILCIALGIMGIVFSRKLIATEKSENQAPSVMPRVSLVLSILALAITVGLMAFALPVALGW